MPPGALRSITHFRSPWLSTLISRLWMDPNSPSTSSTNNPVDRSVAGLVFRALHERPWTFHRTLTGQPASGHVHGQAQFDVSSPTTLLYREQGQLTLSSMKSSDTPMNVSQRYLYVYDEKDESLKVYFVEKSSERGALFHQLRFESEGQDTAWGEHHCKADHYLASYLFVWNGRNLSRFEITYTVRGPQKDYISKTIFE